MDADILESMLTMGKLDDAESKLIEGMLKYNIDRMPMEVLKISKERFCNRISWLCDSLQVNGSNMKSALKLKSLLTNDNFQDARKIYNSYMQFISDLENEYDISVPIYYA